jgi:hypothetical protein
LGIFAGRIKESRQIAAVSASMRLDNRGEITYPGASADYKHAFTPDIARSSNLLLQNTPETLPNASKLFKTFRTGKNPL